MNKSLRLKLTMIFTIIILGIVLCSTIFFSLFLGDYYIHGKQKTLIETFNEIDMVYSVNDSVIQSQQNGRGENDNLYNILGSEFKNNLERISESRSMSIVIFRTTYRVNIFGFEKELIATPIYSSMGQSNSNEQINMFNDYQTGQENADTLKEGDNYRIQKMYVQRLGNDYLYLVGALSNGDGILLRASMDGIERSASIANRFYLYVSLAMIVLGGLIINVMSHNFTQPILDLAVIAAHMSSLDFTTKYNVNRQDEIGLLGNSMNYLSSTLETTLAELKSANAKLQKDLENKTRIDNMRKEFLSNVSHELKTPIALIQGYAEGLIENVNDDEESRNFYCEVIVDEATKMNNIVKKLLDLNQLEFGENNIQMQHFDVASSIANALASADILFKQKEVQLEYICDGSMYVWADSYMVDEVFNNYLSNALNHVDFEKIIRVKVEQIPPKENHPPVVRISVFNTGKQIPEEDIDKIWGKFYKVDKARTREYGGSGVGLSIVKATMELLGQKYGVCNKDNGVEFWFELDAGNKMIVKENI